MQGTNTALICFKQTREAHWNPDRLVSKEVDRRIPLYSHGTHQIQSAISNTPDIISKNECLMEDWNSHPRYCPLWYSRPCFYKWIIASVSLRQHSRPRTETVSCFILASSNAQYWHHAESTKIKIGKHINFMTNIEPSCSKTTPSSEKQKRSQSCPPVADLRQAKTKMRKWSPIWLPSG